MFLDLRNPRNLPQELLLSIFDKGMETELRDKGPCSRRLKTFASLMRDVCHHWRAIIDDPLQTSFWIARPIVRMSAERYEVGDTKPLAEELATFNARLRASKGCDLSVIFATGIPTNSGQDAELRLMLHALDMLTPYQSQVVQLRLYGELGTGVTAYLLEQIKHWKQTDRLLDIDFSGSSGTGWATISQSLVHPTFMRLSAPQATRPTWLSPPATMAHLENLDRLEIPSASWLNGGLTLPHTLRHLTISHSEGETIPILYRYLSNNTLCNHLRSIYIGVYGAEPEEESEATTIMKQPPWKVKRSLIVPHLFGLYLHGAAMEQISTFVGCLVCPSLDCLELGEMVQNVVELPAQLEHATTSPPLSHESTSRVSLTDGANIVKSQFIPIGSHCRPIHLKLYHTSSYEILMLLKLRSINTHSLEDLMVIMRMPNSSREPQQAISQSIPVVVLGQQVFMPFLTNLSLNCDAPHQRIMPFLSHLLAPSLISVDITLRAEPGSIGEPFQGYSLVPFPSLKIMKINLMGPSDISLLLLLSEVSPNLQELHIAYRDYDSDYSGWGELPIFKDSVMSLCHALGPTAEGFAPFSNLSFLNVRCTHTRLRDPDGHPDGWRLAIQESGIHTVIDEVLMGRVWLGALPLYKIELVLSCGVPVGKWDSKHPEVVVQIKASSITVDMEALNEKNILK